MLTETNIRDLFEYYKQEYCAGDLIILEELKEKVLEELKHVSDTLRKTTFKDFTDCSLNGPMNICVTDILTRRIQNTFLTSYKDPLECKHIHLYEDLFNIIPPEGSQLRIIDDFGRITGKTKIYQNLRKLWTEYLSFSMILLSDIINFLKCLILNKNTFTEGKVKEYIREYGSNRKYKI